MDEITKAVELTKARVLELNAAYLRLFFYTSDPPRTYDDLRLLVEKTADEWTANCVEIRERIAKDDGPHLTDRN